MTGAADVWSSFTRDPRRPEHAALRASDADRDVVHHVLTEAYADGRLDREEFDVRSTQVGSARVLGALPAIVDDLVPDDQVPSLPSRTGSMTPTEIDERAVAAWASHRREALWGFLAASLICWTIWLVSSRGQDGFDFPWPLFVMLGTGLNVGRVQFRCEDEIATERRHLEKKQRKQIEQRRKEGDS